VEQTPIGAWSTFTNTSSFEDSSVKADAEDKLTHSTSRIDPDSQIEHFGETALVIARMRVQKVAELGRNWIKNNKAPAGQPNCLPQARSRD
jgi:hypothetical protein